MWKSSEPFGLVLNGSQRNQLISRFGKILYHVFMSASVSSHCHGFFVQRAVRYAKRLVELLGAAEHLLVPGSQDGEAKDGGGTGNIQVAPFGLTPHG